MEMKNYVEGKVIIVTGAGSGFGKLISEKAAAMGGKVVCADVNEQSVKAVVEGIKNNGLDAAYRKTDVTIKEEVDAMVQFAIGEYRRVDVLINNAGTMPLAFFADHQQAWKAWDRCIDINLKGVIYCMSAVYDPMIEQGQGHIVNISSIYSNHPVVGSGVYQATKIACRYVADTLRQEARGKIKVSIVRPTGVPGTGLGETVVNPEAIVGLAGQNVNEYIERVSDLSNRPELTDKETIAYYALSPEEIADNVMYVVNQPWGVNIGDITIRASAEPFIM
jgi:NADP-dependent 3-hydroxy acid dehydrogenase YdfG